MCNCLQNIKNNLEKELIRDVDWYVNGMNLQMNRTFMRFTASFPTVSKKGLVSMKRRKSFISHAFCPFCGEKYGDGNK